MNKKCNWTAAIFLTGMAGVGYADWPSWRGPTDDGFVRYDLPGFHGLNFTLHNALQGGQTTGMRADPNAKGMGQQLATFPVPVTPAVAAEARARLKAMQVRLPEMAA